MKNAIQDIRRMINRPEQWDFGGAQCLYAGVDLGTFKTIVIVVDETGKPRAAAMRRAEVVRSGLILDYIGALKIVRELMAEIRQRAPQPIEKGATSYPPETESGNVETTRYIVEGAELEVLRVLDEPTAANLVIRLRDGAIVDVGGGTTGIAVIRDGRVAYTADEATGGVHLSLVLAGSLGVSTEEAEKVKVDPRKARDILPVVRPVIDKIASIVEPHVGPQSGVQRVCLVGGTCELEGFADIVAKNLGVEVFRPPTPQVITPYGIALSCLNGSGPGQPTRKESHG